MKKISISFFIILGCVSAAINACHYDCAKKRKLSDHTYNLPAPIFVPSDLSLLGDISCENQFDLSPLSMSLEEIKEFQISPEKSPACNAPILRPKSPFNTMPTLTLTHAITTKTRTTEYRDSDSPLHKKMRSHSRSLFDEIKTTQTLPHALSILSSLQKKTNTPQAETKTSEEKTIKNIIMQQITQKAFLVNLIMQYFQPEATQASQ